MYYHNNQCNQENILQGIRIDEPKIFVPWDTSENAFKEMFKTSDMSVVSKGNYFVKDSTIFGERLCNLGFTFEITIRKVGISRSNYEEYHPDYMKSLAGLKTALSRSFAMFQKSLIKEFGEPSRRDKVLDEFESCEWNIGDKIKVYHYVIDRFGLSEYLFIENVQRYTKA